MTSVADLISAAQPQAQSGGTTAADLLKGAGLSDEQIAQGQPAAPAPPPKASSTLSRVGTGVADPAYGMAQILSHVLPESWGGGPRMDTAVAEREKAYQAGRAAAGSTGFDWARTIGNVASPANYVVPGGEGATAAARLGGAAVQGAATSAMQPVNEPGNFWGGKIWQGGTGALVGLLGGGAIEALSRPLTWAGRKIAGAFSNAEARTAAAQGAIDQTLQAGGIKTTDLPPEFVDSARAQVAKGEVRPDVLRAQAEAASLPVPMQLPEAMAGGDAAQYSLLINRSKTAEGAAEGAQIARLHQQLVQNVDALGAENAPAAADVGQSALTRLAQIDQQLDKTKNAAYGAARDSQGRSATLDAEQFRTNAQSALERENLQHFLPAQIGSVYDDITGGKLPFTVDTMMSFDKMLSRAQRTETNGNSAYAIGLVRRAMADTPVSSAAGDEAIAAYQKAKGLARAQFALADPKSQSFVPGYAAMLKGMGNASHDEFISALEGGTANADPEKWFTQNVTKGAPAGVSKLLGLFNQNGAVDTVQQIQHGTMGALRDQVVKGSSEAGRDVLSGDALNKALTRNGNTLSQILPRSTVDGLQRLANTATRIQRPPANNSVNWSNTAPALVNLEAAKEAVGTAARMGASLHPVAGAVLGAKDVVTDLASRRAMRKAASEAAAPAAVATQAPAVSEAGRAAAYRAGVPLSALVAAQATGKQ